MCTRGDAATPYCNSDFGSDDEDAEFRLYAQLYFETVPDAISTAYNNESLASNCEEVNKLCGGSYKELQVSESQTLSPVEKTDIPVVQTISDRAVTKTTQSSCRVLERDSLFSDDCVVSSSNSNLRIPTGKQSESLDHVTSPVLDERDASKMSDTQSSSIVDTESSLAGKTSSNAIEKCGPSTDLPLTVSTDTYFPSSAQEKIVAGSQNFLSKCKYVASDSCGSHKQFASVALPRDRLSSICSEGSIPGSLPLDSLYCNMELDDILEEDVQNRVSIFDPQTMYMYQKTKASGERRPRKRKRSESEESLHDENEDSRCDLLQNLKGKNAKKNSSLSSKKPKPAVESDSDVDLYIIGPPSPKLHEVYSLTTTSDEESEINIKVGTQKKTKKEKLLTGKESTVSSIISGKKQVSVDTLLLNEERRCINDILSADLIELDSDSDSDTNIAELTSGTDLTLNVDRDLSPFINRLTKHVNTTSSVRKSSKKPKRPLTGDNRYNIDFTLYRPDTKKNPSCDKWTQEMANFYDSDISEDFDISDVHQQQSDSPADWKIISSDYYVTNSRRYYAKQDRCTLCRQFGHPRSKCSRVPCCHMCSETDHKCRRQCPQNCCFGCGGPFHVFCMYTNYASRCTQCSYNGHREEQCPDAWRRYHLTTSGLTAQTPGSETTNRQYCCVCGKIGHFGHECPDRYRLKCSYVPVPQTIMNTFVEPTADVQVIEVREVYKDCYREAQGSAKEMVLENSKHTHDTMVMNERLLKHHGDWCSQFLNSMTRKKARVKNIIRMYRSRLKKPKKRTKEILGITLDKLQVFQDNLWRYKKAHNTIIDQRLKDMKKISIFLSACDGNLDYRLGQLTSNVQACSSNIIPEEMCTEICETIGSVFAPPLKSFKHILETANSYLKSLTAGWQRGEPMRINKKLSRKRLIKWQQGSQLDTTNTTVDCEQVLVPGTSFIVQSVKKVKRKRGKKKVKGGNSLLYEGDGIPQACAAPVPQGKIKTTTKDQKKRVIKATKKKTTDAQSSLKATGGIATNANKKRKVFVCKKIKTFKSEVTLQKNEN